jgi:hypothetical protein
MEDKLSLQCKGYGRSPEKLEIDSIAVDMDVAAASPAAPAQAKPVGVTKLPSPKKAGQPGIRPVSGRKGQGPHWSTTPDGALLSRATACVYKKIISPAKDGGLKVN